MSLNTPSMHHDRRRERPKGTDMIKGAGTSLALPDNKNAVVTTGSESSDEPGLERESVVNKPDFEIRIPDVQEHKGERGNNTLPQEVMLKKAEAGRLFRAAAHALLAQIGKIDPFIEDVKMKKTQEGFKQRFDSTMEKLRTARDISLTGPFQFVLGQLFRDYWNEQGAVATFMAKVNKQRMGELEHAFILKTLSQKIEETTTMIEKAETAEQARFHNDNLKQYLRIIVEWDNEYQRLYKSGGISDLGEIYKGIEKTTHGLDRVLIAEGHTDDEGNRNKELAKDRELSLEQDGAKKRICSELLERAKAEIRIKELTLPVGDDPRAAQQRRTVEKETAALRSVIPILVDMEGTADCKTLSRLLNQYKSVTAGNGASIYSEGGAKNITNKVEVIEDMIRARKEEVF